MAIFKVMGLFAVIPTALLLAVSFFVLFAIRKIQEQGLKAFGYVIAAFLWVGAALVFSVGVYTVSTGRHPGIEMMQQMMKCKMQGMMPAGHMPGMMQGRKQMMMKDKTPTVTPGQMDQSMMKK